MSDEKKWTVQDELQKRSHAEMLKGNDEPMRRLWQLQIEAQRAETEAHQARLEQARLQLEQKQLEFEGERLRIYDVAPFAETAVGFAHLAVKSLLLLNGGAAVALIAFAGHLLSGSEKGSLQLSALGQSALLFGCGAAAGAIVAVFAYFTQYCYGEALEAQYQKNEKRANCMWERGARCHWTAVLAALSGAALFIAGLVKTSHQFVQL